MSKIRIIMSSIERFYNILTSFKRFGCIWKGGLENQILFTWHPVRSLQPLLPSSPQQYSELPIFATLNQSKRTLETESILLRLQLRCYLFYRAN